MFSVPIDDGLERGGGLPHQKWALVCDHSGLIYGAASAAFIFWCGGDEAPLPQAPSTLFSVFRDGPVVDRSWGVVVERGMTSLPVVEDFDVFE